MNANPSPWDPFGIWRQFAPAADQMAQLARPLADAAGNFGSLAGRTALSSILEVVRRRLVGQRFTLGTEERPLTLTLTTVDVAPDAVLLAAGQADDVTLQARDVTWGDLRFRTAQARLRNLHTRPTPRSVLVAAPVDIEAVVDEDVLAETISRRTSRVALQIVGTAAQLRLARHPEWGWIEVTPSVEGSRLFLRPASLGIGSRAWAVARRVPPVHVNLDLSEGVRVTGLELGSGGLTVRMRVDEWRLEHRDVLAFAASATASRIRRPAP